MSWIFINKNLDENRQFKEVKLLGSIKAIEQLNLTLNGKIMTYKQLVSRISESRFWYNEDYYILEVKKITSKPNKKQTKKLKNEQFTRSKKDRITKTKRFSN